jgi:hypothetical protein
MIRTFCDRWKRIALANPQLFESVFNVLRLAEGVRNVSFLQSPYKGAVQSGKCAGSLLRHDSTAYRIRFINWYTFAGFFTALSGTYLAGSSRLTPLKTFARSVDRHILTTNSGLLPGNFISPANSLANKLGESQCLESGKCQQKSEAKPFRHWNRRAWVPISTAILSQAKNWTATHPKFY